MVFKLNNNLCSNNLFNKIQNIFSIFFKPSNNDKYLINKKMESDNANKNILFTNLTKELPPKQHRYIVLDCDTTGLDLKEHKLISISAIEVINGTITGFQFNATLRQRDKKTKKNNKNYFMNDYCTEGSILIEKNTMENFLRFIGESKIFAHNANYDCQFINKELKNWDLNRIKSENFICTLKLSKIITGKKLNLEDFCKHYNIECNTEDFHNGIYDTYMLARVVCKIYSEYDRLVEQERQSKILAREGIVPMEITLTDINLNNNYLNVTMLVDDMSELKLYGSESQPKDLKKMKNIMKNYLSIK
jgi:DNA polymerase-3 subunit epsilon